ncbi:hypothetical protein J6590_074520 [Homalodisca vitripennis]|nr:hypothetical protein J6590_074520 [Homalodisca vitripennis]
MPSDPNLGKFRDDDRKRIETTLSFLVVPSHARCVKVVFVSSRLSAAMEKGLEMLWGDEEIRPELGNISKKYEVHEVKKS